MPAMIFSLQDIGKREILHMRRSDRLFSPGHFRPRRKLRARKEPLNRIVIIRIWQRMHHLTSHSPVAVSLRHKNVEIFWKKKMRRENPRAYERGIHTWL